MVLVGMDWRCPIPLLLLLGTAAVTGMEGSDPVLRLERRVGDNVSIPCVGVRGDEKIRGIIWYQDGGFYSSLSQGGLITHSKEYLKDTVDIMSNYSLLIKELEVNQTGNYTCKIFVEDQDSIGMKDRNVTRILIVQDVPSPPGQPWVSNIKSRQVTVSWDPSEQSNNSPITNYIIHLSSCSGKIGREVKVGVDRAEISIGDLIPHMCYVTHIMAKNSIGRSAPSNQSIKFFTESEVPSMAPQDLRAQSLSSTEIQVQWRHPPEESLNGDPKGYEVSYGRDSNPMEVVRLADPSRSEMLIQGLLPYTFYKVAVRAYNDQGSGPMAELVRRTAEGVPSKPRITHLTNRMANSFYVHWEPSKNLNGELKKYELQWRHNDTIKTRFITGQFTNPMSAFITSLEPYTEYKIQVAAYTGGGKGDFSDEYPALTDVIAPTAPAIVNLTVLTNNTVQLSWEPPEVVYKQVDNYLLKWWDNLDLEERDRLVDGDVTEVNLTDLPTNRIYKLKISAITRGIFSKALYTGEFSDTVSFALGGNHSLPEILDSGVIKDGIHDPSVTSKGVQSEDVMSAGVITGVILAIIIVLIVVLVFIGYKSFTCRKCYQAFSYYLAVPSNSNSTPPTAVTITESCDEKEYPEIPVGEFVAHVETLHADSDFLFSQEFEDINKNTRTDLRFENSTLTENRAKNRYVNIAAFDHSRVLLKTELTRLRHSDYINANYVDGYKKPKAYIATQGPLPQTFADFWRMVWEQNCYVVVMITNLMERGRRKCDQYWPNEGLEIYGSMSVKLLSTTQRAHYTVRTFSIRNMKKHSVKGVGERTVFQYHYTEWPDHGVPDYTLPVLTFVQKSAEANPEGGGPIIVHCSAGVGRTGTYMLIDSMIRKITDVGTINIPQFLLHVRKQRNYLVQTEDQYMFIHDVLVEYIQGVGDTEVSQDALSTYIARLTQPADKVEGCALKETNLDRQYKLVTAYTPSDDDTSQALKAVNKEKNRSEAVIPINLKRVILPARPGVEGSDYINATYLQGFSRSNEFIVSQHPLESTKEDFWRMIWDRNSAVIIVLSQIDDKEFLPFWPNAEEAWEIDAGNFKVTFRDEQQSPESQIREFLLESTQYDYTFCTRMLFCSSWPDTLAGLHTVFDLILAGQKYVQEKDVGPITVVDRYGGVNAGKFCALWTLRNQMLYNGSINVYQLMKLYHLKRPGVIGAKEDYLFLHRAMEVMPHHTVEETESVPSSPKHHSHSHSHGHGHGSVRRNGTLPHNPSSPNGKTEVTV